LGLLFVQLNLGRVGSPELVQLQAGSREQPGLPLSSIQNGKDAKRGKPYGLPEFSRFQPISRDLESYRKRPDFALSRR
jgi:hypothetical protein